MFIYRETKQILHFDLNSEGRLTERNIGGARGVVVIVLGNGHGDTSSNPGRDWLHFT